MQEMRPQRLDITLAFKAISLSEVLSGTEKQVAAAIVDSFNFRTQQCDPSFDRIAHLVGKSRRTVIRAVERLETIRFLTRTRHGGHFNRNAYQPNWAQFRSIESHWSARRKTRHWGQNLSPSNVTPASHLSSDTTGTQTIQFNHSSETSPTAGAIPERSGNRFKQESGLPTCIARSELRQPRSTGQPRRFSPAVFTDPAAAARLAAERRWNSQLTARLRDRPELFEQAIDAIDQQLQGRATEAEMTRKGTGLPYILDQLIKRGLRL
ncbi:MAG: helix-turn-helix domain-containing protein [Proteobacteria bacterium]|nr:helix-turn-helix domain-containing protein [Pseudomonadota bacterium]